MKIDKIVNFLKHTPIFSSLPDAVLRNIATFTKELHYTQDEIIFKKGDIGNSLYIIYHGEVKICHNHAVLAILKPFDIVGEMSLIDPGVRSATVIANGDATLFRITKDDYLKIIDRTPSVNLELSKLLVRKIRNDNQKLFKQYKQLQKRKLIEKELEIAQEMQQRLLPQSIPDLEGLEIAAKCISARQVGGDFYDFIEFDEKSRLGIVTGDVCGKGVYGSILMANSKGVINTEAIENISPSITVQKTNKLLHKNTYKTIFVALFYAIIDIQEYKITYSCAGQPLPLILRDNCNNPFYFPKNNIRIPLGVMDSLKYDQKTVQLQKNDLIICCSDGLIEVTNLKGEIWGFDRYEQVVSECKHLHPATALEYILDKIYRFKGDADLYDDLTIVVIKVK